jgi:hypothetical protein
MTDKFSPICETENLIFVFTNNFTETSKQIGGCLLAGFLLKLFLRP